MKKIIPNIVILGFTFITVNSGVPLIAGGCSSHTNKNAKIECAEEDSECKKNNAEKYVLEKTLRS